MTWDNRNVLETGTDSATTPCDSNTFTRNLNYGATTADQTVGMVLRCASNTLVANNTFHGMQYFVFAISHNQGGWGGSVDGLRIVNNVISVATGKVYGIDTALPASVVIDHNVVHQVGHWPPGDGHGHGHDQPRHIPIVDRLREPWHGWPIRASWTSEPTTTGCESTRRRSTPAHVRRGVTDDFRRRRARTWATPSTERSTRSDRHNKAMTRGGQTSARGRYPDFFIVGAPRTGHDLHVRLPRRASPDPQLGAQGAAVLRDRPGLGQLPRLAHLHA